MNKIILSTFLILLNISAFSQHIQIESRTLAGTKHQLPFWLWANQLGRYDRTNKFVQDFVFNGEYSKNINDFGFEISTDVDILLGKENSVRFTELFGLLNWKSIQLKAGAFAEAEKYSRLSASNGNLAITRNARPHPAIRIGFNKFVPVLSNWLSVYGFYEEGLLNDERYVSDTHLHHKAFYFKIGTAETLTFKGGLEHFVMWGGTHPTHGELPKWDTYFDYVLGKSGGENALLTDQINVLGNQFGTYQVEISKEWKSYTTTFYISHPFEDRSGLELENYRDNLYGLFIQKKQPESFVNGILIEYYYTKNQSGAFHLVPQDNGNNSGRGRDNYFNHGIYRSGVTYEQFGIGSPFFSPVVITNDISNGFVNTRFSGVHFGANGYFNPQLTWQAMVSKMKHFGQYDNDGNDNYNPPRKQLSTMFSLNWFSPGHRFGVKATIAADQGSVFDDGKKTSRLGTMISLSWNIR